MNTHDLTITYRSGQPLSASFAGMTVELRVQQTRYGPSWMGMFPDDRTTVLVAADGWSIAFFPDMEADTEPITYAAQQRKTNPRFTGKCVCLRPQMSSTVSTPAPPTAGTRM